jgi:hypothetical protein
MADTEPVRRRVFVDFMYAIVVGAALPFISKEHLHFSDPVFYGLAFLIAVVLEDYFLYETEVARFQDEHSLTIIGLVFEISILICWYFSAVSIPEHPGWFLGAFALFYFLKLCAGWAHWKSVRWESVRNCVFVLPISVAMWIGCRWMPVGVDKWVVGPLFASWLLTIIIWWSITHVKRSQVADQAAAR